MAVVRNCEARRLSGSSRPGMKVAPPTSNAWPALARSSASRDRPTASTMVASGMLASGTPVGAGTGVGVHAIARSVDTHAEAGGGVELGADAALPAGAAGPIVAVDAVAHQPVQGTRRVRHAAAGERAAGRATGAAVPERAELELAFAAPRPALAGHDVDGAADGVGAVERRRRAAQHLDAIEVDDAEVRPEARDVALRRGGVAEAQAVDEHGRAIRPQPADAHPTELAGAAGVAHLDAGREPDDVGDRRRVAGGDLVGVDHADGLRRLQRRLRQARRGDDDRLAHAGGAELDVVGGGGAARQAHQRDLGAEAGLVDLDDVVAGRERRDGEGAGGVAGRAAADAAVLAADAHLRGGHGTAVTIGDGAGQAGAVSKGGRRGRAGEEAGEGEAAP